MHPLLLLLELGVVGAMLWAFFRCAYEIGHADGCAQGYASALREAAAAPPLNPLDRLHPQPEGEQWGDPVSFLEGFDG